MNQGYRDLKTPLWPFPHYQIEYLKPHLHTEQQRRHKAATLREAVKKETLQGTQMWQSSHLPVSFGVCANVRSLSSLAALLKKQTPTRSSGSLSKLSLPFLSLDVHLMPPASSATQLWLPSPADLAGVANEVKYSSMNSWTNQVWLFHIPGSYTSISLHSFQTH